MLPYHLLGSAVKKLLCLLMIVSLLVCETGCKRGGFAVVRIGPPRARPFKNNQNKKEEEQRENVAFDRAIDAYQEKRFEQAIKHLEEAAREEPRNADILHLRGLCYSHLEQHQQAVDDLTKGLELNPRDHAIQMDRASSYASLKQFSKALSDYETVAKENEDQWDPLNEMAWILATCSDDSVRSGKKAVELAKKACRMTKFKDDIPVDTLAAAFAEDGQFDKAIICQKDAIMLAKDKAEPDELTKMKERLELYESNTPYRSK
jgi:tetratricopeptide (TPR) repeat protein